MTAVNKDAARLRLARARAADAWVRSIHVELVRKLDFTAEELFDQIERSVIYDLRRATGKEYARDKIAGAKYKKTVGGGRQATEMKVKIRAYRYPEVYEARFTYARGTNTIRYQVEELPEGGVQLTYFEDFASAAPERGLSAKLQRAIYERQVKSRAEKTLKQLEKEARAKTKASGEIVMPEGLEDGDDEGSAEK